MIFLLIIILLVHLLSRNFMISIPSAISIAVHPKAYDPTENVGINAQTDCTRLSFQTWNIFIRPWEGTRSAGDIAVIFHSYFRNAVPPSPCKFNCVYQTSFLKCTVLISHKNTNSGECRPLNHEDFLNLYFFRFVWSGRTFKILVRKRSFWRCKYTPEDDIKIHVERGFRCIYGIRHLSIW